MTLLGLGASTAGSLFVLIVLACLISYIATHPPRRHSKRTPKDFGAAFEVISFPARDGAALSGWHLPAKSAVEARGVVILCHGMMKTRADMLGWAEALWEHGFALLLFDFRGYGRSADELCSAGYKEALDLLGALDYVERRPELVGLPIGVFGFSMGGAVSIMTAADDLRIQAVATLGAFASLDRAVWQRCKRHFGPFGPIAKWAMTNIGFVKRWYPVDFSRVSPINAVTRITPRPLLLLHGAKDKIVNLADARDLYGAAGYPKELHILTESQHGIMPDALRQKTEEQVAQFFCNGLPARISMPSSVPSTVETRLAPRNAETAAAK